MSHPAATTSLGLVLDDETTCYRHPEKRAAVACQRCERPICTACMTSASVGFHCPECARTGAQRVVRRPSPASAQRSNVVVALMAANALVFVVQGTSVGSQGYDLRTWGLLYGPAVGIGEWWRIVTAGFLHANLLHLGFNLWAMWAFGPAMERGIGAFRFGVVYAAGLLGGSAAVTLFAFDQPTLGASGAVMGLAGGLVAILSRRGVKVTQTSLGGVILLNLALPLLNTGISFWGHFGGVAAGFAVAWLLAVVGERTGDRTGPLVITSVGVLAVLAAAALARPVLGL